jgi:O-antigen/teichoic acid export membrane protein
LFEYLYLTKFAPFLSFKLGQITSSSFKTIYNYSLYIFIIAVAMKLLFYTDSIIIGIYLETEQVTFYAIPTMILQYLEQFVWAFIAVLLPIISGLEALGNKKANSSIYQLGTKYALLGCSPIFLVLFVAGDDFIGLWMGAEYKEQSGEVMHILLIGYIFFLAQLTAHGILKGLSKHKILAVLLSAEALFNLGLSQYLAPIYGINGVAMGTVIPLIVINHLPAIKDKLLQLHCSFISCSTW